MDPYKAKSSEYVEPSMLKPMEDGSGAKYVTYEAIPPDYVEPTMLEPMEDRDGAGYVPLCVALQWIMTAGGSLRVRLDDAKAWASAVAKLRPFLATGNFEVIGLPGAGGLPEVIPSTAFALVKILPPVNNPLVDILLSSPSHIDCACYLGDENWIKHFSDQLYVTGKRAPVWTHLQVRKAEILSRWPKPTPIQRAETACIAWLTDVMRNSPTTRPKSKDAFWNEARLQFPGLARRQFERAWNRALAETGATGWSKAGRPKGSRSKSNHRTN